jgi:hypothetical protein
MFVLLLCLPRARVVPLSKSLLLLLLLLLLLRGRLRCEAAATAAHFCLPLLAEQNLSQTCK